MICYILMGIGAFVFCAASAWCIINFVNVFGKAKNFEMPNKRDVAVHLSTPIIAGLGGLTFIIGLVLLLIDKFAK